MWCEINSSSYCVLRFLFVQDYNEVTHRACGYHIIGASLLLLELSPTYLKHLPSHACGVFSRAWPKLLSKLKLHEFKAKISGDI